MNTHTPEPELVMAYHDGQLPAAEAEAMERHVAGCRECQALLADLGQVSAQIVQWTLEESTSGLDARVLGERPSWGELLWQSKWKLGFGLVTAALIAVLCLPNPRDAVRQGGHFQNFIGDDDGPRVAVAPPPSPTPRDDQGGVRASRSHGVPPGVAGGVPGGIRSGALGGVLGDTVPRDSLAPSPAVMIARTASLIIVSKDFPAVRTAAERIVVARGGYFASMEIKMQEGAARSFTATLRVPSADLDVTLDALRTLGAVQQESRGGEEVTQQYQDLAARIANSRNTERSLAKVLTERTGKMQDVLEVEREIARVRGEIEQMEAEQRGMEKRVKFATITLTVVEQFKAELAAPSHPSSGTRLWNAMIDGFREAREDMIAVAEALLRVGPIAAIWLFLLFWPARWVLRQVRSRV